MKSDTQNSAPDSSPDLAHYSPTAIESEECTKTEKEEHPDLINVINIVAQHLSLADLLVLSGVSQSVKNVAIDHIQRYSSLCLRVFRSADSSFPWYLRTAKVANVYHDFTENPRLDLSKLGLPDTVESVVIRAIIGTRPDGSAVWGPQLFLCPPEWEEIPAQPYLIILSETIECIKLPERGIYFEDDMIELPILFYICRSEAIFAERRQRIETPWTYDTLVRDMKTLSLLDASGQACVLDPSIYCIEHFNISHIEVENLNILKERTKVLLTGVDIFDVFSQTGNKNDTLDRIHYNAVTKRSAEVTRLVLDMHETQYILPAWYRHRIETLKCPSIPLLSPNILCDFSHLRTLHLTQACVAEVLQMKFPSTLEILSINSICDADCHHSHDNLCIDTLPSSFKFLNISTSSVVTFDLDIFPSRKKPQINVHYLGCMLAFEMDLNRCQDQYLRDSMLKFLASITYCYYRPPISLSIHLTQYKGAYDTYTQGYQTSRPANTLDPDTMPSGLVQEIQGFYDRKEGFAKLFCEYGSGLRMVELCLNNYSSCQDFYLDSCNLLVHASFRKLPSLILTDCLINVLPNELKYLRFKKTRYTLESCLHTSDRAFIVRLPATLKLLVVTNVEDLVLFDWPYVTERPPVLVTTPSPRSLTGLRRFKSWEFQVERRFDLFHVTTYPKTWNPDLPLDVQL